MCGEWVSMGGKLFFIFWEEDGRYCVMVMYRNYMGGSEVEIYFVWEMEGVLFIEMGFVVMMDYDWEKDCIWLLLGGEYRRKSDGILKQ